MKTFEAMWKIAKIKQAEKIHNNLIKVIKAILEEDGLNVKTIECLNGYGPTKTLVISEHHQLGIDDHKITITSDYTQRFRRHRYDLSDPQVFTKIVKLCHTEK